jgi:flagellar biogenesis protein FliO
MPSPAKRLCLLLVLAGAATMLCLVPGYASASPGAIPGATGYASASPGATGYASAPPRHDGPIPFGPPGHAAGRLETTRPIDRLPSLGPMAGGLAIVLGLFLAAAWALRQAAPKSATLLPGEVVEVLGRAPLAGRQQMHLLRCGNKLLLVSVTPAGAETLTEVTDPVEVDRLAGLCRQAHPKSATATFRQVFQQLGAGSEVRHV